MEEAYVLQRSIDSRSYGDLRDAIREELALAELQLSDARTEQVDVEGILAFAEHVIGNAASLWTNASANDRRALQQALFPSGLSWGPNGFGTAVTCLAFNALPFSKVEETKVASPGILSWNQIALFLESMRQLRDPAGVAA